MTKKPVIMTIDNVRIIQDDKINVSIEQLDTTYNARLKKDVTAWRFKGYHNSVQSALRSIVNNDMIIDYEASKDAERYLEQVEKATEAILEVINAIK